MVQLARLTDVTLYGMSFGGKVVFVSGASSGIGAATAREFAKEGANVVIVARNEAKMNRVASECEKLGERPLLITADISEDAEAVRAMEETIRAYGKLDILVNNAGMLSYGTLLDGGALAASDRLMKINFRAALHLTQLAAPHLVRTRGSIVNVSSVDGSSTVSPPLVPYSVTKAALEHMTRGAARELAPHGVRVNAVSPGPVYTDIYESSGPHAIDNDTIVTPLGTISQSEEIAHLVLFLCSDKAKAITGSNYVSDNGYLLLPV